MKRRTVLALLLLFAILAALAVWVLRPAAPIAKPTPPRPVASIVLTDKLPEDQSLPGVITAKLEVPLAFQTLGRLIARDVDLGDKVRKDQVLAMLDPQDSQDELTAARASVDAAAVAVKSAEAAAARARALAQRNIASTAQLEQAEEALKSALAMQEQAESQLISARDSRGFTELRAPFDGVISAVWATPGAVITAGEPVLQLAGQNDLEAVIDVPAMGIAALEHAQTFEIWSENYPDVLQQGHLSQIEPVADAATRTRRVHLSLAEKGGFLLGSLVRARPTQGDAQRLSVPTAAMFQRDGATGVWRVTRTADTARVNFRPIDTIGPEMNGLQIVTSGLSRGDEIVIRGVNSLTEGDLVGARVAP